MLICSPQFYQIWRLKENMIDGNAGYRMSDPERWSGEWAQILMPLTPHGMLPQAHTPARMVMNYAAQVMSQDQLFAPTVVRPDYADEGFVEEMTQVAAKYREVAITKNGRTVSRCGSDVFAKLNEIGAREYASKLLGGALDHDYSAAFLYYVPGDFIPLHIDNGATYPMNLLLCLRREKPAESRKFSVTYLVDAADRFTARDLAPGEALWFHAARTLHGRTPLQQGEEVLILTLGFRPVA
jgi:hypothetical protein